MVLIKSLLSLVIFILSCAIGAFCFWIGGGQPFTYGAGAASVSTIGIAAYLASAPWVFIGRK